MSSALSTRAQRAQQVIDGALSAGDFHELDALVQAVATELGVEIAGLSMLSDKQVVLSHCGTEGPDLDRGQSVPFENTICANALRSEELLDIPDTQHDARVSSVPAVQHGLVGAYLGSTITDGATVIGVLCAASPHPRKWSAADRVTLDRCAARVLIELRRLAGAPVG